MKKQIHILLTVLLVGALTLPLMTATTGCQHARDFKESNPLAYDMLTEGAKALLLAKVPDITDDALYQASLNTVIEAGFLVADAPQSVAAEIDSGLAEVYPDDPELREQVRAQLAEALRDGSDATAPASAPGAPASAPGAREYRLDLADALDPDVSYDYAPHRIQDLLDARDEQVQRLLMVYNAPPRDDAEIRDVLDYLDAQDAVLMPGSSARSSSHWSDPLWRSTEWFSGVDSMAALRAYHSE